MYEDINERLEAATSKAEDASGIMHDVANGAENEYITTESGEVPTIPEFLRLVDIEINEGVDSILTEVNQVKDDTEQLKQDTQQILDDTEQVAIEVSDNKDITEQNVTESINQTTIATNAANSASSDSAAVSQIKSDVEQIAVDVGNDASQVSSDKGAVTLLKQESEESAELSRKWAEGESVSGDTPSDSNNAKYWSDRASQFATGALVYGGIFTPAAGTPYPPEFDTDIMYLVNFDDPETTFTYTDGDLNGTTVKNGNAIIYNTPENKYEASSFVFTGVATVNGKSPDGANNVDITASDVGAYSTGEVDTLLEKKADVTFVLEASERLKTYKPEFIAHRGFKGVNVENTTHAVISALKSGADATEFDVQFSADGTPYLFHDTSVDNLTDGTGVFTTLSDSYIESLSFTSAIGTQFESIKIPKFEDVIGKLQAVEGNFYPEIKKYNNQNEIVNIIETVKNSKLSSRCIWQSGTLSDLILARDTDSLASFGLLINGDLLAMQSAVDSIKNEEGTFLILAEYSNVLANPSIVSYARNAGVDIAVWTVPTYEEYQSLLQIEVFKIMSDYNYKGY